MECALLYNEPHHQIVQAFSASARKSIINLYIYHLILLNFVTLIFSAVSNFVKKRPENWSYEGSWGYHKQVEKFLLVSKGIDYFIIYWFI